MVLVVWMRMAVTVVGGDEAVKKVEAVLVKRGG